MCARQRIKNVATHMNEIQATLYKYHEVSCNVPLGLSTSFTTRQCSGNNVNIRETVCDVYVTICNCNESHYVGQTWYILMKSEITTLIGEKK